MNLEQYIGKNVSVVANNGNKFRVIVADFFFADDNDSGMDSIIIKTNSGEFIEFPEDDIAEIFEQ
jgi:hypothetical protein